MDGNKPGASVAVLEADAGEDRQDLAVVLDVGLHDPDVEEDGEVPPVSGREDTGRGGQFYYLVLYGGDDPGILWDIQTYSH